MSRFLPTPMLMTQLCSCTRWDQDRFESIMGRSPSLSANSERFTHVCVCSCVNMHVCTCVCACECMHVCTHVCMYMCLWVCVYAPVSVHLCVHLKAAIYSCAYAGGVELQRCPTCGSDPSRWVKAEKKSSASISLQGCRERQGCEKLLEGNKSSQMTMPSAWLQSWLHPGTNETSRLFELGGAAGGGRNKEMALEP